jgi:hypothetical protein
MAPDEEVAPAGDIPSRICEICEATMTHLSDLQPRLLVRRCGSSAATPAIM